MSAAQIIPFITKGYGLTDEDLNEIIPRENLKDISALYSSAIKNTQERFNTDIRIRVLQFNRNSGSDYPSQRYYNILANSEKTVFYNHLFSNKDSCVFFIFQDFSPLNIEQFNNRIVPHEFAHHFQFVKGFPCLLPKGCPSYYFPEFAKVELIGPQVGEVFVDGLVIDDARISFFKDFSERVGDFVCESMLIEKGFIKGLKEEYLELSRQDLKKTIPKSVPNYYHLIRYMNRLGLRDEAEWHHILRTVYNDDSQLNVQMKYGFKRIMKDNKELSNRKEAFKEIIEITAKTHYTSFKDVRTALDYIKRVSGLLNLEIRCNERW
jgi:hypothetical protein